MKRNMVKAVSRLLRTVADNMDAGNTHITEDEAVDIFDTILHIGISKEQAQEELNLQHSRFNQLMAQGKIPKGKSRKGFKELIWYRDEIRKVIR